MSSCDDIHHCRTLTNIIWSCVSTIILCLWKPAQTPPISQKHFVLTILRSISRVFIFLGTVVAPELTFVMAFVEWRMAGQLATLCELRLCSILLCTKVLTKSTSQTLIMIISGQEITDSSLYWADSYRSKMGRGISVGRLCSGTQSGEIQTSHPHIGSLRMRSAIRTRTVSSPKSSPLAKPFGSSPNS